MSAPLVAAQKSLTLRILPGAFPVFAALGASGLVLAVIVRALGLDHLGFTVCFFKSLTGWPCLSCGTTRALALLANGDLGGALLMNPLATLLGMALAALAVVDILAYSRGRALRLAVSKHLARVLRFVVPAIVVVNWVYLAVAGR